MADQGDPDTEVALDARKPLKRLTEIVGACLATRLKPCVNETRLTSGRAAPYLLEILRHDTLSRV
jgi:hypothetical protein